MIKHKHHIIPRHAGGTDDANNLIELTVAEHAEAHRVLYEIYGKKEDEVAWKCLSGIMSKQELVKELALIGAKKGGKLGGAIGGKKGKGRKQTTEWIEKRKSFGVKNGMFGKKWTDEENESRSIFMKNMTKEMGDDFVGSKNLKESTKKRAELGILPSQQKWTCEVCGKNGVGLSNYNRWHKNRCVLKN